MLYYLIYITFLIVGIALSFYLLARLWPIRKTPGAVYLIWAISCVVIWSFTYIFEIALENRLEKMVWAKAEYLGIPYVSLAIFAFAAIYSGRAKWLTRARLGFLLVIPTISLLLAVTNDWNHLLWSTVQLPTTLYGPLLVGHGPWYMVNVLYSYALFLIATFFLIQIAVRRQDIYRSQAAIMLTGMAIPWVGNIIYVLHPGLDWTPLAFTVAVLAFEIGFARFGLMDILPITQSAVFNAMRDGVIVTDARGLVLEINLSAQSIFHMQAGQIIGQDVQQFLPAGIEWNTETSTAFEIDQEIILGDEPNKRYYNFRISPILDHNGRVNGHMAIFTDITDQKLAQVRMLLQVTALEAAENGIVITNKQGEIEWANPAFARLTGYSREEVQGKSSRILKSGKQPAEYYQDMWQTILSGKVWHGDLINRRKDGSAYYEEMTITPLVQPSGVITNFIAIKQDISKRKNAEEQLLLVHEQAVEANRLKTQLLASVSHDLRTPLGTILGYSELLQSGALGLVTPDQVNATSGILDSANRMLNFVNNLIGQAQIETGRVIIRPSAFKPIELLEGVISVVGLMIKKKGLTFETGIDPGLPDQILADPYWLKQILLNLVNNASKFTEKGFIRVWFFLSDETHWAMQVSDSGIGIPGNARESIFEPFKQVDGEKMYSGSGLGLAIVNQLTTLMNGRIELQSEMGAGSVFTIILPLNKTEKVV